MVESIALHKTYESSPVYCYRFCYDGAFGWYKRYMVKHREMDWTPSGKYFLSCQPYDVTVLCVFKHHGFQNIFLVFLNIFMFLYLYFDINDERKENNK